MFSFHILDGYINCFPKLSVAMNKQVVVTVYLPYCRQLYDHCVRSAVMGKKSPTWHNFTYTLTMYNTCKCEIVLKILNNRDNVETFEKSATA